MLLKDFELIALLGKGSFGSVILIKYQNSTFLPIQANFRVLRNENIGQTVLGFKELESTHHVRKTHYAKNPESFHCIAYLRFLDQ